MTALRAGLGAWLALALWQILWHGYWLPPTHSKVWVALLIALLPLCLPLLAWRDRKRMLLVAGMVCLFYFAHGVADLWVMPSQHVLALVEVVLSLFVIVCASWRRRRVKVP